MEAAPAVQPGAKTWVNFIFKMFNIDTYEDGPKGTSDLVVFDIKKKHIQQKASTFCGSIILSHSLSELAQWEC